MAAPRRAGRARVIPATLLTGERPVTSRQPDRTRHTEIFVRLTQEPAPSLASEVLAFLRETGKWWLAPIFFMLLLLGALVTLGGSAAAPLIYVLF